MLNKLKVLKTKVFEQINKVNTYSQAFVPDQTNFRDL
jgi:hypothetical protein